MSTRNSSPPGAEDLVVAAEAAPKQGHYILQDLVASLPAKSFVQTSEIVQVQQQRRTFDAPALLQEKSAVVSHQDLHAVAVVGAGEAVLPCLLDQFLFLADVLDHAQDLPEPAAVIINLLTEHTAPSVIPFLIASAELDGPLHLLAA